MGVEIVGADITQVAAKDGIEGDNAFENKEMKQGSGTEGNVEPIKFGSHGMDIPVKGEAEAVPNNFPKDAVDEWPAPKQIHSFYLVRFRAYEDPKLKGKIDQAEKELQKKNQARFQLTETLRAKRSERAQIISQLKPLTVEDRRYRSVIDDRRKEMEPLNQALGKLRGANNTKERGVVICSSEEQLDELIQSLNYRIQHESNTLVEEKQILKEIKQLEGTRERVIANAAMTAKIQDSLGQKEAIQDQVKLIGLDMDEVRKEQQGVRTKIKHLEEDLKSIENEISSLQEELTALSEKRDKAFEGVVALRKQRDEGNAHYYQNRSLLNSAKELAAKKDVAALEKLSQSEVEKFMSLWSSNKSFRADYEKRILPSLDMRQLSRDGRIRNPDEKPLVETPAAPIAAPEPVAVAKSNVKRAKEDPKPSPQPEVNPGRKVSKEDGKKLPESDTNKKVDDVEEEDVFITKKAQTERSAPSAVDEAKLKEMKRQEEIAKAKMALERKKKLAEKAAAKAAIRAQKEAEKKLKEREKRAKKKAGGPAVAADSEELAEPEEEVVEPVKAEVKVEAPPPSKPRERRENTLRPRRGKGQDALPKAILKRRKSTPYWVWAAPAAVLVVMLVVVGYYYLL